MSKKLPMPDMASILSGKVTKVLPADEVIKIPTMTSGEAKDFFKTFATAFDGKSPFIGASVLSKEVGVVRGTIDGVSKEGLERLTGAFAMSTVSAEEFEKALTGSVKERSSKEEMAMTSKSKEDVVFKELLDYADVTIAFRDNQVIATTMRYENDRDIDLVDGIDGGIEKDIYATEDCISEDRFFQRFSGFVKDMCRERRTGMSLYERGHETLTMRSHADGKYYKRAIDVNKVNLYLDHIYKSSKTDALIAVFAVAQRGSLIPLDFDIEISLKNAFTEVEHFGLHFTTLVLDYMETTITIDRKNTNKRKTMDEQAYDNGFLKYAKNKQCGAW